MFATILSGLVRLYTVLALGLRPAYDRRRYIAATFPRIYVSQEGLKLYVNNLQM